MVGLLVIYKSKSSLLINTASLTFCRPQYSADWGDYVSFAARLREQADEKGVDLLLIDTGDRIEGNGIYDASDPKGKHTYDIFRQQKIDVITTGNHELYQADAADREYDISVPNSKGTYLASNLDYIIPKTGEQVPMAQRYRKFTTKNQKIEVLAFGFLFDFTGNGNNTVVQKVEDTIKEKWFQDAIREKVDFFVIAGHVTLPGPEYKALYRAIRDQNWDTPIQFFGGHSHIRDFHKYDSAAYGIQSGRYMETIGWMSIEGIPVKGKKKQLNSIDTQATISFKRRYIDNNLFGYHYHTGLNDSTFPTDHGKNVSESIHQARVTLDLDYTYGCAPKNLWLNRAKYPSNDSILTWLETEVIPDIAINPERQDIPTLALVNSGAMRFDIFKGAFTRDSTYILSPFVSKLLYIKDVPYKSAKNVITLINNAGQVLSTEATGMPVSYLAPPEQISFQSDREVLMNAQEDYTLGDAQRPLSGSHRSPDLIPGYITKDAAGDDGDDTQHAPISFYRVPNCIQTEISLPADKDPKTVDLVFIDFIQPWVLQALAFSGSVHSVDDVKSYRPETFTELVAGWIKKNWGQYC